MMTTKTAENFPIALNRLAFNVLVAIAVLLWTRLPVSAGDYLNEFDGPEASWKISLPAQGASLDYHSRERGVGRSGGAESVRIAALRENVLIRFEHAVPRCAWLDELEASLWVKSNIAGAELAIRIVLADVRDPETHEPLTFLITGDKYQASNQWQQLKCRTTDRAVKKQLRELRANKQVTIDTEVMYVDQIVLRSQLPPGQAQFQLDDLEIRPFVRFQSNENVETASATDAQNVPRVQFEGYRLYVGGKLFLPKMITGQGERPEVLSAAGMNVVFVPDYENTRVTAALRRQGLWITSVPPYAKGSNGEPLEEEDGNLPPLQDETAPIIFWTMGFRMTGDSHPRLPSWVNQVRNADRRFRHPISADVIEKERLFSRSLDMLGISKHVINSGYSLIEYRDGIIERRDQAWPDTFIWTWIQTEPAPTLLELAKNRESPPVLEPEQIRTQVYAALAAGCRGMGYWTTTPLDQDTPAARERKLILTQLNLELDLFEPWIASGSAPQLVSFGVDPTRAEQQAAVRAAANAGPNSSPRVGYHSAESKNKPAPPAPTPEKKPRRDFQAALFRSDKSYLVLPMWLDETSQFVVGPSAARNVSLIIPGADQTAAFWEITTTGELRYLSREPGLGGVKVKLPRFDQTAAILVTSDSSIVEELNQKILAIREQSAEIQVELARLKLDRIRRLHESLPAVAVQHPEDARGMLLAAKRQLESAETALRKHQYSQAALAAAESLEHVRLLQFTDWQYAARRLTNPTQSPWALSFQSLAEHYRLLQQIESSKLLGALRNLLPSGEFEEMSTLVSAKWKSEQSTISAIESSAGLYGIAKQGKNCLRLSATLLKSTGESLPKTFAKPLVTVVSPVIPVHAGQVIQITGWAKVPQAISGNFDGAMIYDNLLGKPGAVRLKDVQDWRKFELIRPVSETGEMMITLSLQGIGEMFVDDLRVVAFEPPIEIASPEASNSGVAPAKHSTFDSLRRLNPLPSRR